MSLIDPRKGKWKALGFAIVENEIRGDEDNGIDASIVNMKTLAIFVVGAGVVPVGVAVILFWATPIPQRCDV